MDQVAEARFSAIAADYGAAIERLARGYERDEDRQRDLVQEILVGIWRALPAFEGRSSLRTWVYRIAHNVAVSHVLTRGRDRLSRTVSLDALSALDGEPGRDALPELEGRDAVARLGSLVRALRPADAQVILLYLEGLEHAEIAEVTGLSDANVAVKVHRIKGVLKRAFEKGKQP
jgi:RNA polymerase sigma-70 factor, ECF subfamily